MAARYGHLGRPDGKECRCYVIEAIVRCRCDVSTFPRVTEGFAGNSLYAVAIPRDRDGSLAPIRTPKHASRFTGLDDKIIAMYPRGMTVREIRGFLAE